MINQPRSNIKQGDTIEIRIDCNNSKIVLENKRTNIKSELDIDQKQSPLPWQIIIYLDHHGDRIRLQ
jgi:bifunctional DNA-binding transcriptional regulator/antitoxin component of YhaV-PrlF toxin-antitoxin module